MTTHTISWILKNIIAPLTPFFAGALSRYIVCGEFGLRLFESDDLAFSMSIMFFIVYQSADRLDDLHLSEYLKHMSICLLIVFLILHGGVTIIKEFADVSLQDFVKKIIKSDNDQQLLIITKEIKEMGHEKFSSQLTRISTAIILLTAICIPVVVLWKQKYKLD